MAARLKELNAQDSRFLRQQRMLVIEKHWKKKIYFDLLKIFFTRNISLQQKQ